MGNYFIYGKNMTSHSNTWQITSRRRPQVKIRNQIDVTVTYQSARAGTWAAKANIWTNILLKQILVSQNLCITKINVNPTLASSQTLPSLQDTVVLCRSIREERGQDIFCSHAASQKESGRGYYGEQISAFYPLLTYTMYFLRHFFTMARITRQCGGLWSLTEITTSQFHLYSRSLN